MEQDVVGAQVGRAVALFTAEAKGEPMCTHASVQVAAGIGVLGDRYATGRGHWSDPRWPDQELTLVEAEIAEAIGIEPVALRRNVVTRGIELETLIGTTFQLGSATLRGVRRCDPCGYLDGLTRRGIARALGKRGGLRVAVLIGGTVSVGDPLLVLPPAEAASPS